MLSNKIIVLKERVISFKLIVLILLSKDKLKTTRPRIGVRDIKRTGTIIVWELFHWNVRLYWNGTMDCNFQGQVVEISSIKFRPVYFNSMYNGILNFGVIFQVKF